jgi:hypothetical protein
VANAIVDGLRAPDLRCVFAFADWRLDPSVFARTAQRGLHPAPVIGGTTVGVIATRPVSADKAAVGVGLYGDWFRVGISVATELPKSALTRSRDAVHAAAAQLGTTCERLDPSRCVGITIFDGRCGHEESFCIGSAAAAPRIRFVGGCASNEYASPTNPAVWAHGEAMSEAGVVVVLESELPWCPVTSQHLVPTDIKVVVTGAAGRRITELDGMPAATRLARLIGEPTNPLAYGLARYVDGVPYVRSIERIEGEEIALASGVEVGHVLRLMRPGDLIGQTTRDLAGVAERVGGSISALLAFSCMGRHWEASARGLERELAGAYAAYPVAGFQSFGEQSGMLLVNHTLMGLAIGGAK